MDAVKLVLTDFERTIARLFEDQSVEEVAAPMMEAFGSGEYPHLLELVTEHALKPGYDFGDEFEFGLELVLDGLSDRLREAG